MGASGLVSPSFVQRLHQSDRVLIGVAVTLADPTIAEALGDAGVDWLFIDAEHSPFTLRDLEGIAIAARASGTAMVIRIPVNDSVWMKHVLDLGPNGVVVPMINRAQDARAALAASRYPPRGTRGFGPRRASHYGMDPTYTATSDARHSVVMQVEHRAGIAAIDAILGVRGVEAIFVGPNDLAASFGHLGEPRHLEVVQSIRLVADACRRSGQLWGVASGSDPDAIQEYAAWGARFILVDADMWILSDGVNRILRVARRAIGRRGGIQRSRPKGQVVV